MDYDFRSAAANPQMVAFNRKMGRGKAVYGQWLSKYFGCEVSVGDLNTRLDQSSLYFFVMGAPGRGVGISLTVTPNYNVPGTYSGRVEYLRGGKTEDWDSFTGLTLDDFNHQSKVFKESILQKMKNIIGGSYDFASEKKQVREAIVSESLKLGRKLEAAQEARFLAERAKSPEDFKVLASMLGDFMEYPRNVVELIDKIVKGNA